MRVNRLNPVQKATYFLKNQKWEKCRRLKLGKENIGKSLSEVSEFSTWPSLFEESEELLLSK